MHGHIVGEYIILTQKFQCYVFMLRSTLLHTIWLILCCDPKLVSQNWYSSSLMRNAGTLYAFNQSTGLFMWKTENIITNTWTGPDIFNEHTLLPCSLFNDQYALIRYQDGEIMHTIKNVSDEFRPYFIWNARLVAGNNYYTDIEILNLRRQAKEEKSFYFRDIRTEILSTTEILCIGNGYMVLQDIHPFHSVTTVLVNLYQNHKEHEQNEEEEDNEQKEEEEENEQKEEYVRDYNIHCRLRKRH